LPLAGHPVLRQALPLAVLPNRAQQVQPAQPSRPVQALALGGRSAEVAAAVQPRC